VGRGSGDVAGPLSARSRLVGVVCLSEPRTIFLLFINNSTHGHDFGSLQFCCNQFYIIVPISPNDFWQFHARFLTVDFDSAVCILHRYMTSIRNEPEEDAFIRKFLCWDLRHPVVSQHQF